MPPTSVPHSDQHGALSPRSSGNNRFPGVANRQRKDEPGPYPVEDGKGVPGVGISKGKDAKHLAEPGLLDFKKPKAGKERGKTLDRKRFP